MPGLAAQAMEQQRSPIEIRMAVPDDAPAIASVLYESFVEYRSSYTSGGLAATTPGSGRILARWAEGPVWVALYDGAIAGTVSAVSRGEGLYIRSMAVLPALRGHKIGELLLRHIEDYALGRGCKRLYLSTTPFLTRAIRLYEAFGFELTTEGPQDLYGTPLFTMVKSLG